MVPTLKKEVLILAEIYKSILKEVRKVEKRFLITFILILIIITTSIMIYHQKNFLIVHPTRGPIIETVYGLGKVKSYKRFEIVVGVISKVKNLYTDEGMEVTKGAPLIKMEDGGEFYAPFTGTVTEVVVRTGEIALPQRPLLRLEDLKDNYLEISLEQEAALRVKRGQTAKISFESIRNKILTGKVSALFSREDEFIVHIQVEGLAPEILPGMTADVSIEIGNIHNAL
jgi:macrolide-specific efflux system membrane fusion protein